MKTETACGLKYASVYGLLTEVWEAAEQYRRIAQHEDDPVNCKEAKIAMILEECHKQLDKVTGFED